MEMLSHLCPDSFDIEVAGSHYTDIDYADDAVLLTSGSKELWQCTPAATRTRPALWACTQTGWTPKSRTLAPVSAPEVVSMYGQTVEPVAKFTYFGLNVDSEGYSTPEIHRRLGMGNSIMGQLDAIWRQQKLSLQTKLRLYTSLVLSVLFIYFKILQACMAYNQYCNYLVKCQPETTKRAVSCFSLIIWLGDMNATQVEQRQAPIFPYDVATQNSWHQMVRTCDKHLHSGDNRTDELIAYHCRPTSWPVRPRLPSAPGNSCSTSPATVHWCPKWRPPNSGMEASPGSSQTVMAAADWREFRSPHQCCLRCSPGQVKLEIATTLCWSCASVSEWVKSWEGSSFDTKPSMKFGSEKYKV